MINHGFSRMSYARPLAGPSGALRAASIRSKLLRRIYACSFGAGASRQFEIGQALEQAICVISDSMEFKGVA